ncbi:MAG: universal stress protein [Rhodothermia bacterium]|nr:universal stress protein [Rhodothermia bacterium]
MKYRRILLPIDLTDKNRQAVKQAIEMVDRNDGSITLLHVVETLDLPYEEMQDFYEQLADTASRKMEEIISQDMSGIQALYEVVFGRRTRSILSFATENESDVIILSSRRFDPNDDGSAVMTISHQVSIFAPCSVVLLK